MQIYTNPARGSISSQLATESQRNTFVKCRNTRLAYKAQRSALIVHASDSSSGGLTSNSSLLGPSINLGGPSLGPKLNTSSAKPSINLDDVPLESGVGVDYSSLRTLLKEGKWREAEDEHRAKLIEAAGSAAQKRGWVYWSEVKTIPAEDMRTLDALWSASSNGKFGFKIQREIWIQNRRQWTKFFKAIDWVQGENNVYRKWPTEFKYSQDAVKGHLPLTNALRGTRLFEAIMEHPAFVKAESSTQNGAASGSNSPDWLK